MSHLVVEIHDLIFNYFKNKYLNKLYGNLFLIKSKHYKITNSYLRQSLSIRVWPVTQQPVQMSGIVEADEMFFLESFKGQRHLHRIARKRGGKAIKRGTSAEQIPVLVVRDRHAETADFVLPGVSAEQIEPMLKPLLNKDMMLCTDGA